MDYTQKYLYTNCSTFLLGNKKGLSPHYVLPQKSRAVDLKLCIWIINIQVHHTVAEYIYTGLRKDKTNSKFIY